MMRRSVFWLANFIPVFMPALSPSMETGTVVEWKKKVGDLVKEGDVFCTIQTDKAVVDYTNSFEQGYLGKVFCNNGQTMPVAKTIAVMVDEEKDVAEANTYVPEGEEAEQEHDTATQERVSEQNVQTSSSSSTPASTVSQGSSTSTSEPPDGVNVIPVFMPALSPSMETGTVVEWKKKVGDLVKEGDVFCTIQTDKAVVDYTNSFEQGYLAKIYCDNGQSGTVAKTIAVMVNEVDEVPKVANYVPEDAVGAENISSHSTPAESAASAELNVGKQIQQQEQQVQGVSSSSSMASHQIIQHDEKISHLLASSGPSVQRVASYLPQNVIESIKPSGKNGRYTKSDFVGQPGFDYNDNSVIKAASAPATTKAAATTTAASAGKTSSSDGVAAKAANTSSKPAKAKPAPAAVSTSSGGIYDVVIEAGPVIKSISDTALLKKLLMSMQKANKRAHETENSNNDIQTNENIKLFK